jgi:hypothetical protein
MGVPSELESDFDHGGACKPGWPSSAGSERRYTAGSDTETALRVQHGLYVGEVPCRDGDPTESACEVSDSSFGGVDLGAGAVGGLETPSVGQTLQFQ